MTLQVSNQKMTDNNHNSNDDGFCSIQTKVSKTKRRINISNLPLPSKYASNEHDGRGEIITLLINLFAQKASVDISSSDMEFHIIDNNNNNHTNHQQQSASNNMMKKCSVLVTMNDNVNSTKLDQIIRLLNGMKIDGRTIHVQRGNLNSKNNSNTKSFGNNQRFGNNNNKNPRLGGWSKPKLTEHSNQKCNNKAVTSESVISTPIDKSIPNLSSKATSSSSSSADSTAGPNEDGNNDKVTVESRIVTPTTKPIDDNNNTASEQDPDFFSRFQKLSMADLLNELGEQDLDWANQQSPLEPEEITDLEHVVDDANTNNENDGLSSKEDSSAITEEPAKIMYENRLLGYGKAPIHIELLSFGYHHGIPSAIQKKGWSYTNPLPPFDCRHLPTVPTYLTWMDGLSGPVRHALIHGNRNDTDRINSKRHNDKRHSNERSNCRNDNDNINDFAKKYIAERVATTIQEAIDNGGHGYALPLRMVIYVGSDSGRHRSVVCCELAGVAIRQLLRRNGHNRFQQPCSVSCYHRELDSDGNRKTHRQPDKKATVTSKKKGVANVLDESV